MVRIAVYDQEVSLAHQLLSEPLDFGDERTGRIDELKPRRLRFLRPLWPSTVCRDRHTPESTLPCLGNRAHRFDPLRPQPIDDLRVVDHIAYGRDRPLLGGLLDNFERPTDPQQ